MHPRFFSQRTPATCMHAAVGYAFTLAAAAAANHCRGRRRCVQSAAAAAGTGAVQAPRRPARAEKQRKRSKDANSCMHKDKGEWGYENIENYRQETRTGQKSYGKKITQTRAIQNSTTASKSNQNKIHKTQNPHNSARCFQYLLRGDRIELGLLRGQLLALHLQQLIELRHLRLLLLKQPQLLRVRSVLVVVVADVLLDTFDARLLAVRQCISL